MGVCYFDNSTNNYIIEKNASTYNKDCYDLLKNKLLNNNNIFSHVGLGHTRWATHGGKTDINSHPHISEKGNIILVHNGIINNFEDLKLKLINNGIKFKSETDSEVIANLIEYYLLYMGNTIEEAIQNTINELEGSTCYYIY